MKAIILAAGRGSRMGNLTDIRPKCMVEFKGRPLIEWQIEAIKSAGINEVAIVTGYRREMISMYGSVEFHNPQWSETNMVASLACASEWLDNEPCIVSYSDIFYLPEAISLLMHADCDLAITYDRNWLDLWRRRFDDPLSDAETFRLNEAGYLLEIGSKPITVDEIQGQYMGLLRISPNGWLEICNVLSSLPDKERSQQHLTGVLQLVTTAGKIAVKAILYEGEWGEIDSQSDLKIYSD